MNPFYYDLSQNPLGVLWGDPCLGGTLKQTAEYGKHKVPTLRNVDKRPYPGFVKAYGHNGYFKTLENIVHFYNNRDDLGFCPDPPAIGDKPGENCWPHAEYAETVNKKELGNLRLTQEEEKCIVAFLRTLTDGWIQPKTR